MTDEIIKPFTILETRQESGGRIGVFFQAEKVEIPSPYKRLSSGMQDYISVGPDEDIDMAVFQYLQNSGWL